MTYKKKLEAIKEYITFTTFTNFNHLKIKCDLTCNKKVETTKEHITFTNFNILLSQVLTAVK